MSEPARGSQTDVVVEGIKRMILEGSISAGGRLPVESELAEQLGVSRGSLREGVRALSAMGVLESRQGSGTYVTGLEASTLMTPLSFIVELETARDAVNLHTVRRVLETAAVQAAAPLITTAQLDEAQGWIDASLEVIGTDMAQAEQFIDADFGFHRVIADAAGNPLLAALIDAFAHRALRVRLWRAVSDSELERNAVREHQAVLDALRAHDGERAAVHMAAHLLGVEDFARERAAEADSAG